MRISDWSSDVCSSDLIWIGRARDASLRIRKQGRRCAQMRLGGESFLLGLAYLFTLAVTVMVRCRLVNSRRNFLANASNLAGVALTICTPVSSRFGREHTMPTGSTNSDEGP